MAFWASAVAAVGADVTTAALIAAPDTVAAEGMAVVSADDQVLGEVTAVRPNCVVVKRVGQTDLYVPLDALLEGREGRVVVNTLENQLNRLGWETPPRTTATAP